VGIIFFNKNFAKKLKKMKKSILFLLFSLLVVAVVAANSTRLVKDKVEAKSAAVLVLTSETGMIEGTTVDPLRTGTTISQEAAVEAIKGGTVIEQQGENEISPQGSIITMMTSDLQMQETKFKGFKAQQTGNDAIMNQDNNTTQMSATMAQWRSSSLNLSSMTNYGHVPGVSTAVPSVWLMTSNESTVNASFPSEL
jgi:hypothetical protein